MKLVEILQGKWLGHPLHPALVHLPVGGWIVACGLDLAGAAGFGGEGAERLALWCVGAALAGALLAVAPGVADWSQIKKEKPAWKLGLYHMLLTLLSALVWALNFGLRFSTHGEQGVPLPVLLTSCLGTALLFAGAYLGKLMVYDHGIGVARQSKKKWRELAARGGANLAPAPAEPGPGRRIQDPSTKLQ